MADVDRLVGRAMLRVERRLERKQAENTFDGTRDRLDTTGTPGPDGRADDVHGTQTASTPAALEAKIEIRGVEPDHDTRPVDTETLKQHTAQAQDARQRWNDLGSAPHKQHVDRGDRPAPSSLPLRPGHTTKP